MVDPGTVRQREDSPRVDSDAGDLDGPGAGVASTERVGVTTYGEETTDQTIDVGVLLAHSPGVDTAPLCTFADRMLADSAAELATTTDVAWRVHGSQTDPLANGTPRQASAFLDEAARHMVRQPYDLVVVVTDVPVSSRLEDAVEGLASPISRVVVVSTWRLLRTHDAEPVRSLDSASVRWNAATLLLHLLGHVFGAQHGNGAVMEPFSFDPSRREVPSFDADVSQRLRRESIHAADVDTSRGRFRRLAFHGASLARNPTTVLSTLLHSRAPLIPFSLPRLATAAVTPTLILVFSAEAWDVGLNLTTPMAVLFATVSIVAAAVHVLFVQRLWFPRERSQVLTEHMALVNVTVFAILVLAMLGLFVLVGTIMLLIEFLIFPPNLMTNWPSLEDPTVGVADLVRVGIFIATLGVLSGALAGGIENRMALRHLALFRDRP